MFLHVQSIQTLRMNNLYVFQTSFFLSNVHQFFQNLERILTLMIRKAKGLELMQGNRKCPQTYKINKFNKEHIMATILFVKVDFVASQKIYILKKRNA